MAIPMVNKIKNDCLVIPIKNLPFSNDFKLAAKKLNFNTVGEILQIEVASLLQLQGFTYHMMQELVQYAEQNKLAHLLKQ